MADSESTQTDSKSNSKSDSTDSKSNSNRVETESNSNSNSTQSVSTQIRKWSNEAKEAASKRMKAFWNSRKKSESNSNSIPTKRLTSNQKPKVPTETHAPPSKPTLSEDNKNLIIALFFALIAGAAILLFVHLLRTGRIKLPVRTAPSVPPKVEVPEGALMNALDLKPDSGVYRLVPDTDVYSHV